MEGRRLVSLLPSATEIVCLLGLEDDLVGVSHECDHPPAVRQNGARFALVELEHTVS